MDAGDVRRVNRTAEEHAGGLVLDATPRRQEERRAKTSPKEQISLSVPLCLATGLCVAFLLITMALHAGTYHGFYFGRLT